MNEGKILLARYLRTYAHLARSGVKWCEHPVGRNTYVWSDTWLVAINLSVGQEGYRALRSRLVANHLTHGRTGLKEADRSRARTGYPRLTLWDIHFETKTIEGSRPYLERSDT